LIRSNLLGNKESESYSDEDGLGESGIALLPITPAIAASAVGLHEHHSDPQDRIIIATALVHDAKLMSDDGKFSKYVELQDRLF